MPNYQSAKKLRDSLGLSKTTFLKLVRTAGLTPACPFGDAKDLDTKTKLYDKDELDAFLKSCQAS